MCVCWPARIYRARSWTTSKGASSRSTTCCAECGCALEFDTFGWETSRFAHPQDLDQASNGRRLTVIRALIDRGHLDQIVIAHDMCQKTHQTQFGGHGYGHIYRNIPRAR